MRSLRYVANIMTILTLFSGLMNTVYATPPKNLDDIKQSLIRYHDSGAYLKDQTLAIQHAKTYLIQRLAERKKTGSTKPLAIVLDIDETALTDYPNMVKLHFGGRLKDIEEAEGKGNNPVILPMLAFYNFAKKNNVAVFFITARREIYEKATKENLEKAGYYNWDGLILRPLTDTHVSPHFYKAMERANLEKRGYDIILNIGDQPSDFEGGHGDKTIKMPNPYYSSH